jgi:urocanate hydratase
MSQREPLSRLMRDCCMNPRSPCRSVSLFSCISQFVWQPVHHGGGVGIGYSLHAGQVIVADGTSEAAERLTRVLTNDPGTGVMRHVDADYEEANECARELGVKIAMLP